MNDELVLPTFGDVDAEGFRTVSFYDKHGGVIARTSLNIHRYQQHLTESCGDLAQYSSAEQEGLKTVAAIFVGREAGHPDFRSEGTLAWILELNASEAVRNIEKHFPPLAKLALQLSSDACIKRAINEMVQRLDGSQVYLDKDVDVLLADLRVTLGELLRISGAGRHGETSARFQKASKALERLKKKDPAFANGKTPTQELFAEELGIQPRTLRDWPSGCGLTWEEFLRACEWFGKAEGN